jgi:hypothetical protein
VEQKQMPSILFDFFVDRHLFENRIVLLSFHPIGCVLFVLGGDVAGHAGHAAGFVLGAFQNDLNAITFFGHDWGDWIVKRSVGVALQA